jgi:SAM-dependent methyltransferase
MAKLHGLDATRGVAPGRYRAELSCAPRGGDVSPVGRHARLRLSAGIVPTVDRSADINRVSWDERAPAHAASLGYGRQQFIDDPSFLSAVVRFDVPLLGDICGLRGVHLQCHIGTDTISLVRLGARMTGIDFSPASVAEARRLSDELQAGVEFVEADVHDAVAALGGRTFDFVFTGIGALCWLPSVARWAAVVADLLAPGGRLFIREGHPVLWSLDERRSDGLVVDYDYFERTEPMVFDEQGTYVETEVQFQNTVTHVWNHGLGEIVTALLDVGMELTGLVEHDSVPWEALPGQMEQTTEKEWRLRERPWRLPHSYTLQAVRRSR